MRKVLLSAMALVLLHTANAQSTTAKPTGSSAGVIIKGGVNFANVSTSSDGNVNDANMLTSFHVGVAGDLPLVSNMLYLQPGLLFTGKGFKTSGTGYDIKTNPLYLEVPVNLVVKLPIANETSFYFGAGPYAAMGVGGKVKGNFGPIDINESIKFSDDDPTTSPEEGEGAGRLKRFDFGINALAGIETHKFLIGVNYGLGLSKINSIEENDNDRNKHRVLSLSVGFKL